MGLSCDIKFDQNPYGIYFAGQVLTGRVELNLDKSKKLKGVCLKIAGYASCSWSESESHGQGRNRKTRTVNYLGREDYVSTATYLVGSDVGLNLRICGQAKTCWNESKTKFVGGKKKTADIFYQANEIYLDAKTYFKTNGDIANQMELPPGLHTYSFACTLPPMLPTSFEGTYGHIRYTVRVILERPWKFDQSYKVAFTVLKEFNLNYDSPILRIPTQMEITKNFWCGPCSSGPFSIVASVPQSGYVPGQKIVVSAEITNMSNIPVDRMKFMLRKIIAYHSQTPSTKTKQEIVVIQERRAGGVAKRDHGRFQIVLPIPPEPPTNTNLCKVIHITYEVKVEAKISGPHQSPFIRIPITIGTVPLNRNTPDPKTPVIQTAVGFEIPITTQPTYSAGSVYVPFQINNIAQTTNTITNNNNLDTTATTIVPSQTTTTTTTTTNLPLSIYSGPSTSSMNNNDNNNNINNLQPIIAPIQNAQSTNNHNNHQDMPPPSYEESLYGNRQIEDAEDQHPISQQPYTPRYPVYHFNEEPQQIPQTTSEQPTSPHNNHPSKIREKIDSWNI